MKSKNMNCEWDICAFEINQDIAINERLFLSSSMKKGGCENANRY